MASAWTWPALGGGGSLQCCKLRAPWLTTTLGPASCFLPNVPQSEAVIKKVHAELERLLWRVPDHIAIIAWAHLLCGVVLNGFAIVPPSDVAVQLWLGSGALTDFHAIIQAYRMLRHGTASARGQQPSMS